MPGPTVGLSLTMQSGQRLLQQRCVNVNMGALSEFTVNVDPISVYPLRLHIQALHAKVCSTPLMYDVRHSRFTECISVAFKATL
jgi:hypothetical protein